MQGMCGERAGYSVAVWGKTFKLNETTLALFSFGAQVGGITTSWFVPHWDFVFSSSL